LELTKKNELVYEALSSKVNGMAEELSELKGQNEIMLLFLQARLGGEIVPKKPVLRDLGSSLEDKDAEPPLVDRIPLEMPKKSKPRVTIKAFQKLPPDLESLVKEQRQLRQQFE
jgi:hypothetical protein